MIDAAWVLGGGTVEGNTGSGDYTSVAYVKGVGKGATITPAGGDTGKTLFVPNTGWRQPAGNTYGHGTGGRLSSATRSSATNAWRLAFANNILSGDMVSYSYQYIYPLRCVRS